MNVFVCDNPCFRIIFLYSRECERCSRSTDRSHNARHSQMVGVGKIIRAVYEKQVSGLSRPLVHSTTPTDRSKDVQEFTKLMIEEDIFVIKPGRKHASFPDMDLLLYSKSFLKTSSPDL